MANDIAILKTDNISGQIVLSPVIAEIWLKVLSDIALHVRLQQGGRAIVYISREETAHLVEDGSLVLVSAVNNEQLTMGVPSQFWDWVDRSKL